MNILVRLPNWLGDLVMAAPALTLLSRRYPEAQVDVVVKQGLGDLAALLPGVGRTHLFRPEAHRGIRGLLRLARRELAPEHYDLYVSFPNSFSAALLGMLAGVPTRVGYRGDFRAPLLTRAVPRPEGLHRVQEYAALVCDGGEAVPPVRLQVPGDPLPEHFERRSTAHRVILNIQSEAPSRRLSVAQGASLARVLLAEAEVEIVLPGTAKERERSEQLAEAIDRPDRVWNWAGQTALTDLVRIVADADLVITTDSGLAHLANAVGTPEIVFFGAGDPAGTAPYNPEGRLLWQDDTLPCIPCVSNRCPLYDTPRCLESVSPDVVGETAVAMLGAGQREEV